MILEIRIRNYAVIDDLTVELGSGLNAITGETGAGKSIIVGALSLLLGERASTDVVRAGEERAVIEAVFDVAGDSGLSQRLETLGLPSEEGLLILRREVQREGRNRAWVNGSPTTATVVGELGGQLVDLHGQHEHQTLLRRPEQRALLDAFGGTTELADEVARHHERLQALRRELRSREERRRELEARADFLRFQVDEIERAEITEGEDEELAAEARRLEHARELAEGANRVYAELYADEGSIGDRLAGTIEVLTRLTGYDEALEGVVESLRGAYHSVADAGGEMADYASSVEHDPRRLGEVRQRLDELFRVKRKYGGTLAEVLETAEQLGAELSELESAEHEVEALGIESDRTRERLADSARQLTDRREQAARRLEEAVEAVLPDLGMDGGVFRVALTPLDEPGAGGAEDVDFLVSLNPGFEPQPLRKVASGGELSRVMLALKSILADVDRIPTLVFDEVDAGIGGTVAGRVASMLSDVAGSHQVLVVTHLPQLASRARGHLRVDKRDEEGLAAASVVPLSGEERVTEIARMLGGDPDSVHSREHARELLHAG